MNLRQIVYVSGQETPREFVVKFAAPFVIGVAVALSVFFYVFTFTGLLPFTLFVLLAILSPFIALGLLVMAVYMLFSSWKSDVDHSMPLFVTFLGTISIKNDKYGNFFKRISDNDDYGKLSKEMKNIYSLAKNWKLGYAKACRVVATITPSRTFSRFLVRIANIIEYGEDIGPYLVTEQESLMSDVEVSFQESIYFIPTLTELYGAVLFSFGFLTIFAVILPLFIRTPIELIMILLAFLLLVFDAFFIVFGKSVLPEDKLTHDMKEKSLEQRLILKNGILALAGSAILALVLFPFAYIPLSIKFAIAFTPCLIGGFIIRKQEQTLRLREHTFTQFISVLGEAANRHRGSFEGLLRKVKIYTYEQLNHLINRLYARMMVTRNVFASWAFFSAESGSRLMQKFGNMFLNAIYSGAEPQQAGQVIAQNMSRIERMRKLRDETSSGSISEVYGSFAGVALTMFITAGLAIFLVSIFSGFNLGQNSSQLPAIGFLDIASIDVDFIRNALTLMIVAHAAFTSLFIKILDGGTYFEALTHFSIMLWIATAIDIAIIEVFQIMMVL